MSTPKSRVVATVAAWALGVASFAAALAALYAPVVPVALGPSPPEPAPRQAPEPLPVIELAPLLIVAERPQSISPRTQTPATRATECGPWRALVQGDVSQRVRPCDGL